jgi:hypothetical protein
VVKKETVGRQARSKGSRRIRGKLSWVACSRRRLGISRVIPFALPIPPPTLAPSKPPKGLAAAFSGKPGHGVGAGRGSVW